MIIDYELNNNKKIKIDSKLWIEIRGINDDDDYMSGDLSIISISKSMADEDKIYNGKKNIYIKWK